MTFMDPAEAHKLKGKLTRDPSQLGLLFKSKKSKFQIKSVDHSLVESMQKEGWQEFLKPLKTKTRLRKLKSHNVQFEDDVWCQLYNLGYRHLNISNSFKLPFGKEPEEKKQIDAIAINDDSILLVECKSSEKQSEAPSYKTEFEGLPLRLDGFRKALEQLFGKERRIKYIFATRNLRLERESIDVKRLLDTGSFFYNDNTYKYINELIKTYKDAAHYQFLALLFKGQRINKRKIEVPALEGKMGGETYYMFSLEPHLLLKMGFVLHRTRANDAEMPTYQRLLVPSRLKSIGKFLNEEDADGNKGYFPNSIVLNFSETENKVEFQAQSRGNDTDSRSGILIIPNAYAIAYIIDGQHRVYGYADSDYKDSHTIPVVAFRGLKSATQLKLFMDINENQKAVSPTLRITLEEDLFWNSKRTDSRIKALRSSIIRLLGDDATSPLYDKISLGEDKASLKAKPFSTALMRCGLLPQAKGNNYVQGTTAASLYDTHKLDHNDEMGRARSRVVSFLKFCYQFAEDSSVEDVILSNRGTFAFISLIGSLNSFETENGNLNIKTLPEDRLSLIKKYLDVLFKGLKKLPEEKEKELWGKLGTGADVQWFRFFQNLVNQHYSDYAPAELIDWKERQDQELQDKGRKFGTQIERHLKKTVISTLKELFGENWELEIGEIQRGCVKRASEEMQQNYKEGLGREEIPWTDMFNVLDYKNIIEKYWDKMPKIEGLNFVPFSDHFSMDIGEGTHGKAKGLKWLSRFNVHRRNWGHEGTKEKGLNREEVNFLEKTHDFFDL